MFIVLAEVLDDGRTILCAIESTTIIKVHKVVDKLMIVFTMDGKSTMVEYAGTVTEFLKKYSLMQTLTEVLKQNG